VGSDRDSPDVCGAEKIPAAEAEAIQGWLAYGAALNEGRALFHPEDDKGFGPAQKSAAMTAPLPCGAAANPEQFAEASAAGNPKSNGQSMSSRNSGRIDAQSRGNGFGGRYNGAAALSGAHGSASA
jgi:hypothetical protein